MKHRRQDSDRRPLIEELEQRILFSADPAAALAADATLEGDPAIAEVEQLENSEPSYSSEDLVRHEIVFVDEAAPDADRLIEQLRSQQDAKRQLEVVLLSSDRDGVEQISSFLGGRDDIDAIHVISHGNDLGVQLGASWLTADTLRSDAARLAAWGDALALDGDLLFYGCDLAADAAGRQLIDAMAQLTGADVAASTDVTGSSLFGGDWQLEYQTGAIETALALDAQAQQLVSGTLSATPASGELLLNTTVTNEQAEPAVAVAGDGSFVAVWESRNQEGYGNTFGIYGQRFDADGNKLGSEFQINTQTSGDQVNADIAMAGDGRFVVVWESTDFGQSGIYGQRFAADGTRLGGEFLVASDAAGSVMEEPSVAMNDAGEFVVAWAQDDGTGGEIFARLYDASGNAAGGPVRVDAGSGSDPLDADVAIAASGQFAVVWTAEGADGSGSGVFGRRFDDAGIALGSEFQVNESSDANQDRPAIAMNASGDFVITWTTNHAGSGNLEDVYARRYDAAGDALGSEFRVNEQTLDNQHDSDVAIDDAGNFTVVWESRQEDGSNEGVFARVYAASGNASGPVFLVNVTTNAIQEDAAVAMNAAGRLVIAWDHRGAGDNSGAFGRVYQCDFNQAPVIADQGFAVAENAPAGTLVGTVSASDPDAGDSLSFAIVGGNTGGAFAIDASTGEIRVANPGVLDFEATPSFALTVEVRDAAGLTSSATVTVDLTNANEAPVIADQGFAVAENAPAGTLVGTVSASDPDAGDPLSFAITGGNTGGAFAIDASTGEIRVANPGALDFEATPSFALTVEVRDAAGLTSSATVTVDLTNVNEATTLALPGPQTVEADGTLVFASSAGNAIRIVDPDAGTQLEVTLVARHGVLTLGSTAGLTLVQGDGVSDASMVFRGSSGAVNAALDGLAFDAEPAYEGSASIDLTAQDLAAGSPPPAVGAIAIQVEPAIAPGDAPPIEDGDEKEDESAAGGDKNAGGQDGSEGVAEGDSPSSGAGDAGSPPFFARIGPTPRGAPLQQASRTARGIDPDSETESLDETLPRALFAAREGDSREQSVTKSHAAILREDQILEEELSELAEQLRNDGGQATEQQNMSITAFERVGLALSAGVVALAARGSSLVAMLLSALPMWRKIDPLILLGLTREERRRREEEMRRASESETRESREASEMLDLSRNRDEDPEE